MPPMGHVCDRSTIDLCHLWAMYVIDLRSMRTDQGRRRAGGTHHIRWLIAAPCDLPARETRVSPQLRANRRQRVRFDASNSWPKRLDFDSGTGTEFCATTASRNSGRRSRYNHAGYPPLWRPRHHYPVAEMWQKTSLSICVNRHDKIRIPHATLDPLLDLAGKALNR
jgi:hypothetical protein